MKRNGEIEPYDDAVCIECSKKLYSHDDYYAIKRNKMGAVKYRGSGFIHIHKACYESLLPKNNK